MISGDRFKIDRSGVVSLAAGTVEIGNAVDVDSVIFSASVIYEVAVDSKRTVDLHHTEVGECFESCFCTGIVDERTACLVFKAVIFVCDLRNSGG